MRPPCSLPSKGNIMGLTLTRLLTIWLQHFVIFLYRIQTLEKDVWIEPVQRLRFVATQSSICADESHAFQAWFATGSRSESYSIPQSGDRVAIPKPLAEQQLICNAHHQKISICPCTLLHKLPAVLFARRHVQGLTMLLLPFEIDHACDFFLKASMPAWKEMELKVVQRGFAQINLHPLRCEQESVQIWGSPEQIDWHVCRDVQMGQLIHIAPLMLECNSQWIFVRCAPVKGRCLSPDKPHHVKLDSDYSWAGSLLHHFSLCLD